MRHVRAPHRGGSPLRTAHRRFRLWRTGLLALVLVLGSRRVRAETPEPLAPLVVELVLVGQAQGDLSLLHRVRSLFEPDTRLTMEQRVELDREAVLQPSTPGTLYVWITFDGRSRARVYVTTRERQAQSARYLYRDIELRAGLDELGSETIAQVAHSSVRALRAGDRETSRSLLISALNADAAPQAPPQAAPISDQVNAGPQDASVRLYPKAFDIPHQRMQLVAAASFAMHASGGEGWLDQWGASLTAVLWKQASVRIAGAYLLPQRFEAPFTRIRLTGLSGELRLGWKRPIASGFRAHVEAGLGLLAINWSADATPPASELPGTSQRRPFALGAIGCERSFGPLILAVRFELRVPTRDTTYEVRAGTQHSGSVHTWLNPGFALEIGLPL